MFFALSGRQQVGLSRKIVMAEVEGSLRRLGTDYLDIYYIHGWHDPSPIGETLAALNDLVRSGKVLRLADVRVQYSNAVSDPS